MATHSGVLAWRIPGTEEPGRLPSLGSHRVGHDWSNLAAVAAASGMSGKESSCQCRRHKRREFDLWVGKISQRRKWQCTSVLLPGEFHVQRSLAGYRPWDHKELDTTEQLSTHTRERQEMTWLSLWEVSSLGMKKGGTKRSIVARYDIYFKIGVKMLWKHSGERNNEICLRT